MSGHQITIATGHLGADPSVRVLPGGGAVADIRIAVTETWRDRNTGERIEHTEWLRVKSFGKLAESVDKYLRKGRLVTVEGRIRTEKWQHSDGSDRYSTWIYADDIRFHGAGHELTRREHQGRGGHDHAGPPDRSEEPLPSDDDIIF